MKINLLIFNCLLLSFLMVGLVMVFPEKGFALEDISDIEALLVETINQKRADVSDDPGTVQLLMDERLFDSAADYIEQLNLTDNSVIDLPDESNPEARILNRKYIATDCGEAIGVVLFQRYLSKGDAVKALYAAMLRNCAADSPCLLDPVLKEIGVSVQTGVIYSGGRRFNYYIAVADLATEFVSSEDKAVLLELNTIRLSMGVPVFRFNEVLFRKAQYDLAQLLSEYGGGGVDPGVDFVSDLENVQCISRIWITTDEKSEAEVRKELIRKIFHADSDMTQDGLSLTGQALNACGVAVVAALPWAYSDDITYYVNAIVFEVATDASVIQDNCEVSGVIFVEEDGDEDAENTGIAEIAVYAYGENSSNLFFTGDLGEFFVELPTGQYTLEYLGETKLLSVEDADQVVFLPLSCDKNGF